MVLYALFLSGTFGLPALVPNRMLDVGVTKGTETDLLPSRLVTANPLPQKDACPETVEEESVSVE